MPWSDLAGHDRPVAMIRRAIAEDRLHHALLLQGPEGIGKRTLAVLLAQALLCKEGTGDPCGVCPACARVGAGTHPDASFVGLMVSESTGRPRQEIVIEQIRELSRFLQYRPVEGRWRIAVVDPAERINAAAANAFLKTLEEPPGASVLMLVTANAAALLPTIRSRCLPIPMARMPRAALLEALHRAGHAGPAAQAAAELSGGALGQ